MGGQLAPWAVGSESPSCTQIWTEMSTTVEYWSGLKLTLVKTGSACFVHVLVTTW